MAWKKDVEVRKYETQNTSGPWDKPTCHSGGLFQGENLSSSLCHLFRDRFYHDVYNHLCHLHVCQSYRNKIITFLLTTFSFHVSTCEVCLLVDLCDAQELGVLLLTAPPCLVPRQSRFGIYLVGNASQWIFGPQALNALNCKRSQGQRTVTPRKIFQGTVLFKQS